MIALPTAHYGHNQQHTFQVAGDTNLKHTRSKDMKTFDALLADTGLVDACRSLACGKETVDRVLFRGSESLALEALAWEMPDEFVDADGDDLSDHDPVAVRFGWRLLDASY